MRRFERFISNLLETEEETAHFGLFQVAAQVDA
jgi:hypothetical protein